MACRQVSPTEIAELWHCNSTFALAGRNVKPMVTTLQVVLAAVVELVGQEELAELGGTVQEGIGLLGDTVLEDTGQEVDRSRHSLHNPPEVVRNHHNLGEDHIHHTEVHIHRHHIHRHHIHRLADRNLLPLVGQS